MVPGTSILAGVGQDRALHLLTLDPKTGAIQKFRNRDPLQPPGLQNKPQNTTPVPLDRAPAWPIPVWTEGDGFNAAISAAGAVWVWREHPWLPEASGWHDLGKLPGTSQASIDSVLHLASAGGTSKIMALSGGRLFTRDWPKEETPWQEIKIKDGKSKPASIAPVFVRVGDVLATSVNEGAICISELGKLFRVAVDGTCTPVPNTDGDVFDVAIKPIAIKSSSDLYVVAKLDKSQKLVAIGPTPKHRTEHELSSTASVVGALGVTISNGDIHLLVTVRDRA